MNMLRWLFREWWFFVWPFLILVTFGVGDCNFDARAQSSCLAAGYPESHTTWNFKAYCSRRINNTDEVIKLP
jgi:hypothetical protein